MPRSIFLIDDDVTNRIVLSALLEDYGFSIEVAASFAEAQERLSSSSARHDVVLLDQHLGDGLGTDLVATIRARLPGVKIVLISGSMAEEAARGVQADAVMVKGGAFPDLLAIIESFTGKGGLEPPQGSSGK